MKKAKLVFAFIAVVAALLMGAALWLRHLAAPLPGMVRHEIEVDGRKRVYYLRAPDTLAANEAVPLVLMFHGGGGTPGHGERQSRFLALSRKEKFIVVWPEAVDRHWNDGRVLPQRDGVDDVAFVDALLDEVMRRHPIDPKRVFATGISNGAILSHLLAARLSHRIAAIAPVVGGMAEPFGADFAPAQPVSVLIIQGMDDPLVPFNGGEITPPGSKGRGRILSTDETVKKWVAHNGCSNEPVVEDIADTKPGDGCLARKFTHGGGGLGTAVVLVRIEGGGHTWPGGGQYLPQRLIGRLCRDFDASDMMWQFFKAHPKP